LGGKSFEVSGPGRWEKEGGHRKGKSIEKTQGTREKKGGGIKTINHKKGGKGG